MSGFSVSPHKVMVQKAQKDGFAGDFYRDEREAGLQLLWQHLVNASDQPRALSDLRTELDKHLAQFEREWVSEVAGAPSDHQSNGSDMPRIESPVLAAQLAKVDANMDELNAAIDAVERAAIKGNETEHLKCLDAMREASAQHEESLADLAHEVRVALYGDDE